MARIGVLGGSGLYQMDALTDRREERIETPFGAPSDALLMGTIGGHEVAFLPRHGRGHRFNPSEVNYRANLWALKSVGVEFCISVSAVGSLQEDVHPGDIVVIDQFIDRTKGRAATFYEGGIVGHVSFGDPVCATLRQILLDSCAEAGAKVHDGGTYVCMEGPAFSTRAESELYRSWGCSVIGMTNHTESRLAREAELAYASLSMVTDFDCWHSEHEAVSVEMVIGNLQANARATEPILSRLVQQIALQRPASAAHQALAQALITPPDQVPMETRRRLDLFVQPYWGSAVEG